MSSLKDFDFQILRKTTNSFLKFESKPFKTLNFKAL